MPVSDDVDLAAAHPRPVSAEDRVARAPIIQRNDNIRDAMTVGIDEALTRRIGRIYLQQRLGLEADCEAIVFRPGMRFFHLENWYSVHSLIRNCLRLVGLHGRARRNAHRLEIRRHRVPLSGLPRAFDGFTILHLSDLHIDMDVQTPHSLIERIREVDYDLCVMTGDYRAKTFGPIDATLEGIARVRTHLKDPIYAVLGNHDSIRMVPGFEALGIRMLLNESVAIERAGGKIYLAGIDDAHYYRVDNIEKAAQDIPVDAVSILLSHTPEPYRQAAHSQFKLMLSGHTHGGQICLPGGIPLTWDATCPRHMAAGAWRYHAMLGYTSVGSGTSIVNARLNCRPELTLHRLECA